MFVNEPVELAKPNLKVGGIAPFTRVKSGMSIKVSVASNMSLPLVSTATERRLRFGGPEAGSNVIWTLFLAAVRVAAAGLSIPPGTEALVKKLYDVPALPLSAIESATAPGPPIRPSVELEKLPNSSNPTPK